VRAVTSSDPHDTAVRLAAFRWLEEQTAIAGEDVLPWKLLQRGFGLEGARVPLVSMPGIFKPAVCRLPLSIRTSAGGPYADELLDDRIVYCYRGTDPDHPDNVGLRTAWREHVPLVYLHGHVSGRYHVEWPVWIVGDEPARLRFHVQAEALPAELGGASLGGPRLGADAEGDPLVRAYATRAMKQRLHQRGFRERVLAAYHEQCAMCRLRHRKLLDAAHIVPDSEGGPPEVPNGIALCKIHHAAFEVHVLGVRPDDHCIHVRPDVLREIDGPMLQHGLQELQGQKLWVPRTPGKRPDPEHLRRQWEVFQRAG